VLELNHQNTSKWPKGTFPFQSPPFWWFMPTQQKATKEVQHQCKWEHKFVLIQIWHIWIILCHHLILFLQINLNFLSLSQNTCWDIKRVVPREIDQRFQKLPLFPIVNYSPHKKPTFDKRDNKRVLTNQKLYSTIFKILSSILLFSKFSSGSWSIYCFGLIFSPFGIKHQNGINLGPLTPLLHKNY
jgi:hypothetical protein